MGTASIKLSILRKNGAISQVTSQYILLKMFNPKGKFNLQFLDLLHHGIRISSTSIKKLGYLKDGDKLIIECKEKEPDGTIISNSKSSGHTAEKFTG